MSPTRRVCQGFDLGALAPGMGLDKVTLAMNYAGGGGSFNVSLYSAVGGLPGSLLTSLVGNTDPINAGQYEYAPSGDWLLTANTSYFIVASATGAPDGPYYWTWTSAGAPAIGTGKWGYDVGSGWQTGTGPGLSATDPMRMRVEIEKQVDDIPEPGTAALMLGGMSVLGLALRRRQRAC